MRIKNLVSGTKVPDAFFLTVIKCFVILKCRGVLMFYLQKKKTVVYTLIIFILFVGMCLGFLVADSVSVCAKTKMAEASIRTVSCLNGGRQEICVQEKNRLTRQSMQKKKQNHGVYQICKKNPESCSGMLAEQIHFHSMTIVSEEFSSAFSEEGIVRYLHQSDGEKESISC